MKKKLLLIILIITFSIQEAKNSSFNVIYIAPSVAVSPYDNLIKAVGFVESTNNTMALNKEEQAYGYFQIRSGKLTDYNEQTNSNYTLFDMYDFNKARKVFLHFAVKKGHNNYEAIAKSWNGSGPKTDLYWAKVQLHLKI